MNTIPLEQLKPYIDLLVPVGDLAAFFWGVWQYFHGKALDVFDRYCEKYNSIVTPDIIENWNKALSRWPLPIDSPADRVTAQRLEQAMVAYLNLVWEEFYLHDEGLIRRGAWKAWRSGIDQTIRSEFACSVLRKYRDHFSEFDHEAYGRIAAALKMKPLGPDNTAYGPLSAGWHRLFSKPQKK